MFERELAEVMNPDVARRVAAKFRYFDDYRPDADRILAATPGPLQLPGFHPTSIAEWVRRHRLHFG